MSIAILLTGFTILLALVFTSKPKELIQILGADDKLIAEISIKNPKLTAFAIEAFNDSIYLNIEPDNMLVLKPKKSKEMLYRQTIDMAGSALDKTLKIKDNIAVRIVQSSTKEPYFLKLLSYWEGGFFSFLSFAMQMMLILVLGHVLALAAPLSKLTDLLVKDCNSTASAVLRVSFSTMIVAFFNWGLGLIFGAVFARKIGEHAANKGIKINYPLVVAAGYSGMMVWHGGLSGSATLKIAEQNHEFADKIGLIPISETIFSTMNISATLLLLTLVPAFLFYFGKKFPVYEQMPLFNKKDISEPEKTSGLANLDISPYLSGILGVIIIFITLYKSVFAPVFVYGKSFDWSFSFVNPNYIIFLLFGMAILFQGSLRNFEKGVEEAIPGAASIMIQFPFYAGIMGIMTGSGLVLIFSQLFESISNSTTFPLFTLISSGIVNFFVPSGGGQWMVQGPIVIEGANALGVSYQKSIMALCYGDQLTNMLQPFWALPLLGITKVKAQEILPWSFLIFLIGLSIFSVVLLIF